MEQLKYIILFLLLCTASIRGYADNDWHTTIKHDIDSLLSAHPVMKHASCGIMVYDADDDTVIYAHEAQKTHRPASTTKLFTCATALQNLGSGHQFKTTLYYTGKIRKKRIDHRKRRILFGDIFVKGHFDPAFSSADMDTLIMALQAHKIDSIAGNLYTDVSMKSRAIGGSGWSWDDTGDDFPLLSPLLVDKDTAFITVMRQKLLDKGIRVAGTTRDSICPEKKTLLAEKSRTLGSLMPQCLKTSDNRYAESFLYQLGNLSGIPYPNTKVSTQYVNALVDSLGFTREDYRFVDGSGLSPYNYVTPEVEVALLKHICHSPKLYEEIRRALPISGVDGTLENRMKGTAAEGKVFAKTGTLSGTCALAGYTQSAHGHLLIFSIMNDGVTYGGANNTRGLQDQILDILCR